MEHNANTYAHPFPLFARTTSCENNSWCCFRNFWNCTVVLARGGGTYLHGIITDESLRLRWEVFQGRPLLKDPVGRVIWGRDLTQWEHQHQKKVPKEKRSVLIGGQKLEANLRYTNFLFLAPDPPTHPGDGGFGTRPWWLALLACGGAYWPLAFEPSAMTSRHPYYCGHPHCRGHPPSWVGIQNATSAHGVLP